MGVRLRTRHSATRASLIFLKPRIAKISRVVLGSMALGKMNNKEHFHAFVHEWIGYVSYSLGILFVLGLLIHNISLGRYGITDIPFFRVQYIIIGITFVIYLSYPVCAFYLPYRLVFKGLKYKVPCQSLVQKSAHFGGQIAIFMLACLMTSFCYYLLFGVLGTDRITWTNTLSNYPSLVEATGAVIFSWFMMYRVIVFENPFPWTRGQVLTPITEMHYIKIFSFGTLFFITLLLTYSKAIHPFVSRSFSGGKPMLADIRISEEFAKIGQDLDKELFSSLILKERRIIYADAESLYLLRWDKGADRPCAIVIPRKYIEYMVMFKERDKPVKKELPESKPPEVKEEKTPLKKT